MGFTSSKAQLSTDGIVVLTPVGVLDSASYLTMRDAIIRESVDGPDLIIVVVDQLQVPAESAWSVFASARWHVSRWPKVPIAIVATDVRMRLVIERSGITRLVPCFSEIQTARTAARKSPRRTVTVDLPADRSANAVTRTLIREALAQWNRADFAPLCCIVGTHLVDMTTSGRRAPRRLRLECHNDSVTLAIDDQSEVRRVRHEEPTGTDDCSDLGILSSICRTWGTTRDRAGGRVLWAVCGTENLW